ncbi:MAG: L,D-transpeptidase family protein [Flavobacteriales bacterium]|nr:L,D-transpeptidase family protein [Flavobacteriales bacterium]
MRFFFKIIFIAFWMLLFACETKKTTPIAQNLTVTKTNEGVVIPVDSVWLGQEKDSLLLDFYRKNQWKTYWTAFNCRTDFIEKLQKIHEEGIEDFPEEWNQIIVDENQFHQLSTNDLLLYDISLTKALVTYIEKVKYGTTDWKSLGKNWDMVQPKPAIASVLLGFIPSVQYELQWQKIAPQYPVYASLKEALAYVKNLPEAKHYPIKTDQKLVLSDTSASVVLLKKNLQYWNYLPKNDSISSVLDTITYQAIKLFQLHHGLGNDGVAGKRTLEALNKTKEQRIQQIILNMERWRLFDTLLQEEDVVVNIPDFRLYMLKNREIQKEYRVIVGKPSRKTPVLSSKITHVVWNPTWTVPPTILKEDVVPAASKNRGYFAGKNIQIFDGQGNRVPPSEWNPSKFRSYRYVQSPGNSNSLGLVKIMFPNQHSVYLHDTNTRNAFGLDQRSLSSGCVRVQDPTEFTSYLLQDIAEWNQEKLEEILASGKTTQINLKRQIQVHLWYWTAWMQDGKPQFRDDIYGWDRPLPKKETTKRAFL